MVDVIADSIIYQEKPARLILSNDVTEKLNAEAELVSHRIMQQKLMKEAAIQVQEKEREEIGKELHDNINQILASTKLYLELALGGNLETLGDAISKSYQNVTFIIEEIRRLTKKLVPPSLDTTLTEAIRDLIDEIQAIAPIKISFVTELDEKSLNENIKLMIYRIVQEQINNILKHAAGQPGGNKN
jgi:two-component system sensor histidine kinase UhpB